ncbi:MAG: hypothetical protein WDW38_002328 [Sanguina aurantia]
MDFYEDQLASVKDTLFNNLFSPGLEITNLLEVGVGSGPNFRYYKQQQQQQQQSSKTSAGAVSDTSRTQSSSSSSSSSSGGRGRLTSVVGLDPNPAMQQYARESAAAQGLEGVVQLVEGSGEALPYPDNSFDAVVCTLVLCSVPNPKLAVSEMLRVLRPGGRLAVLEHVLAPPDRRFIRVSQGILNPVQRLLADGCNLNRDTLVVYREAGFGTVEVESFEAKGLFVIAPHIVGIATKAL